MDDRYQIIKAIPELYGFLIQFLFQMIFKERRQFRKRNQIDPVIKIDMTCARYDKNQRIHVELLAYLL